MFVLSMMTLMWLFWVSFTIFALRHPRITIASVVLMLIHMSYNYALGSDIDEKDFPKLIHVVGVVRQPDGMTTVIKVRNDAKYLLTAKEMAFVCWSSHSFIKGYSSNPNYDGGVEEEWEPLDYRPRNSDGYVPPGTTRDVVVNFKTDHLFHHIDIGRCTVGATKQQAAKLAGLSVDNDDKVDWGRETSDRNALWRPTFPVLPPEPKR